MDSLLSVFFLLIPILICMTSYNLRKTNGNYIYFIFTAIYGFVITRENVLLQLTSTISKISIIVGIIILVYYGVFQSYRFWKDGSK